MPFTNVIAEEEKDFFLSQGEYKNTSISHYLSFYRTNNNIHIVIQTKATLSRHTGQLHTYLYLFYFLNSAIPNQP